MTINTETLSPHFKKLYYSLQAINKLDKTQLDAYCCSICLSEFKEPTDRYLIKEIAEAGLGDHSLCVDCWQALKTNENLLLFIALIRYAYSAIEQEYQSKINRLQSLLDAYTGEESA